MGVFDKFMSAIRINNDDDYDEDEEFYEEDELEDEEEEIEEKPKKKGFFKRIFGGHSDEDLDEEYEVEDEEEEFEPEPPRRSFGQTREAKPARAASPKITPLRRTNKEMEMIVIKPVSMEDTKQIADTLLSARAVVLNLEGLDVEIAQRVIDFSSGACYSIKGSIKKVSSYIFILTPPNVGISGDITDILSNTSHSMRNNL